MKRKPAKKARKKSGWNKPAKMRRARVKRALTRGGG